MRRLVRKMELTPVHSSGAALFPSPTGRGARGEGVSVTRKLARTRHYSPLPLEVRVQRVLSRFHLSLALQVPHSVPLVQWNRGASLFPSPTGRGARGEGVSVTHQLAHIAPSTFPALLLNGAGSIAAG